MTFGLPPAEFWTVTLREADVLLRAATDRHHRMKQIEDGRAYSLAFLISFAVNDPKKMPKFEKVFPDVRPKPAKTPEEMLAVMRQWVETVKAVEGRDG